MQGAAVNYAATSGAVIGFVIVSIMVHRGTLSDALQPVGAMVMGALLGMLAGMVAPILLGVGVVVGLGYCVHRGIGHLIPKPRLAAPRNFFLEAAEREVEEIAPDA
jgi:hypothetical protein